MDVSEMRRLLAQFEDEQREVAAQSARLALRSEGLEHAVKGIRAMLAAAGEEPERRGKSSAGPQPVETDAAMPKVKIKWSDEYPRGAEAVRLVLQDTGREMTVKEITAELLARGWSPRSRNPENATSSNAARAVEVYPEVARRRGEHGLVYAYVPPDEDGVSNATSVLRLAGPGSGKTAEAVRSLLSGRPPESDSPVTTVHDLERIEEFNR